MKRIRSLLCVPAHKEALFDKGLRSDADALMFDLEDSVPIQHKNAALALLIRQLERHYLGDCDKEIFVRVNPGDLDINALDGVGLLGTKVTGIVVPKVRFANELFPYLREGVAVLPVIETPMAILNLESIINLSMGGIFGVADYSAGMCVSDRWGDPNIRFAYAKQKLATIAAAYGKQALDTSFHVKSEFAEQVTFASWREVQSWGFTGAACIHPGQVGIANHIFSVDKVWPTDIIVGSEQREGEVWVDDDDCVVGTPTVRQARNLLARAEEQ